MRKEDQLGMFLLFAAILINAALLYKTMWRMDEIDKRTARIILRLDSLEFKGTVK